MGDTHWKGPLGLRNIKYYMGDFISAMKIPFIVAGQVNYRYLLLFFGVMGGIILVCAFCLSVVYTIVDRHVVAAYYTDKLDAQMKQHKSEMVKLTQEVWDVNKAKLEVINGEVVELQGMIELVYPDIRLRVAAYRERRARKYGRAVLATVAGSKRKILVRRSRGNYDSDNN